MWYPPTVTVAPASEPVTLAEAKLHCRVDGDDEDVWFNTRIAAVRSYVEKYTGIYVTARTVTVKCDSFTDFANIPVLPLGAVSSVSYVDVAGNTQTLPSSVYEVRSDGLEASVVLKAGQSWPTIQTGSRITLTASAGYAVVQDDLKTAILFLVADAYRSRENTTIGVGITQTPELPHAVTALLANYRVY